ncbi:hypothetical protein [Xanthobacter versatilis]|uniref:hypothetical protein n=1 Tax=Xanthobacter autotrophicus (strain ATCC BAA-1158 / Py2) TaxID=78245 RepID=UPI00372746C1
MARGLRMGRRAYGVFIAAYVLVWGGLIVWGVGQVPTVTLLSLPLLHFIASAARLADTGLNFWTSLLALPLVNFGAPIVILCILAAFNDAGPSSEYMGLLLILIGTILFVLFNLFISIFCIEFRRPQPVRVAQPAVIPQTPQPRQGPTWVDTGDGQRLWVDTSNEP